MRYTWRNFFGFVDAPETKHNGHVVEPVGPVYVADPDDDPDNTMRDVRCTVDGETFSAFTDELEEVSA